jgi:hypothetical protein
LPSGDRASPPQGYYAPPSIQQFSTERLQLAIYIHATEKLSFLGCELVRLGALRFVFADPECLGKQIELEFDRGAAVPATVLFASQKFLRRTMTEVFEKRNIGQIYEHSTK